MSISFLIFWLCSYLIKVIPETYLIKVIPETYLIKVISETYLIKVIPETYLIKVIPETYLIKVIPEASLIKVIPETYLIKVISETYLIKVIPETYLIKVIPETDAIFFCSGCGARLRLSDWGYSLLKVWLRNPSMEESIIYTVGGHNYFTKMAAIKNQLLKHPISLSYLIYM
jgi:hypothetical protein